MSKSGKISSLERRPSRRRKFACLLAVAAAIACVAAPAAQAAERVYWGNYDDPNFSIGYANVDGSGGANLPTPGVPKDGPQGFSLNPSTGTIYWSNYGEGPYGSGEGNGTSLGFARLDGSGGGLLPVAPGTVHGSHGTAFDPSTGTIYWTNQGDDTIRFSNIDGSGGGVMNTGSATVSGPRGLALDRAGGRIYWANHNMPYSISYANLNGSGGANLPAGSAVLDEPEGVAIYKGRVYFGGLGGGSRISYVNTDGSGGGNLPGGPATVSEPHGVAVDPITQTIYWVNYGSDPGRLSYEKLDGSDSQDIPTTGATMTGPALPMLLREPSAGNIPVVHGSAKPGSKLSCTAGTFGADMVEAQFYQSPQSVSQSWLKNGKPIAGANGSTLKVHDVADYRCSETGTNAAGATTVASKATGVFKIGKLKLNLKKGTATLKLSLPFAGTLTVSGKGVAKHRIARSTLTLSRKVKKGSNHVLIKAKGKAKRKLAKSGHAKVKAKITFTPKGGAAGSQVKKIKLKKTG